MRLRFFFIILIVLTVTSLAMAYLHSLYLVKARMSLIDGQLREAASALVQSRIVELSEKNIKNADDLISEELGENRIGKFFIVRDDEGKKLYESASARLLPFDDVPRQPQKFTLEKGDYFVRVLNLKLPRIPNRTLQVGLVLSSEIVSPGYFYDGSLFFIGIIICIGLVTAWFLASTLLRPINDLANFMMRTTHKTSTTEPIEAVPANLKGHSKNDEYYKLVEAFDTLIMRINRGYKTTRLWTYQMAHELKTPLAVLAVEVQATTEQAEKKKRFFELLDGVDRTMNSFLSWAEFENADAKRKIYANRVSPLMHDLCQGFESLGPTRIQITEKEDFHVFCDPEHLRQCLGNVITNALRYSDKEITIAIEGRTIKIQDFGPGVPQAVLERLGDPFNRGELKTGGKKGQGLGLAWVASISRLYGWSFELKSSSEGTVVVFKFPMVS